MDFIDKCTYEAMTDHGEVIYPDFSTPEKRAAFKKQQEEYVLKQRENYKRDLKEAEDNPKRQDYFNYVYEVFYAPLFKRFAYLFKDEK